MLENDVLKAELKEHLKLLNLNKEDEKQIIKEINHLSDILIDMWLKEGRSGQRETA